MHRNKKNIPGLVLLLSALFIISSCQSGEQKDTETAITTLYQGLNCGGNNVTPGLKLLSSVADLKNELSIPLMLKKIKLIDFSKSAVLKINMGQKRSGGYGLKLNTQQASIQKNELTIKIDWREPAANSMVTQALTSPCLYLLIPSADFDVITLVDQSQNKRLQLTL
ncbi:MAG: protease complex subunit PrcB family protein [Gammaproteobacteria bacterium]|nr:protease complex subunit PrcB family protein [Gammaproteobacteria bacterium]